MTRMTGSDCLVMCSMMNTYLQRSVYCGDMSRTESLAGQGWMLYNLIYTYIIHISIHTYKSTSGTWSVGQGKTGANAKEKIIEISPSNLILLPFMPEFLDTRKGSNPTKPFVDSSIWHARAKSGD